MNYFELHIGDYQRKTAHLSLAEHGAYSLMLQTFYASERPLPADRKVLHRLLRAETSAERKAVDSVIAQFWQKTEEGLINGRGMEVLATYKRWVEKQKANGSKGGRPKETRGLANGSTDETQPITQSEPNGGDRAFPTSHLNSPSRLPINPSPQTPPPFGEGASRETRSERRSRMQEAIGRWNRLVKSGGADRDGLGAAMAAVGGWPAIQMCTVSDEDHMRKTFCAAYLEALP